jgi:hypothetical protein
MSYKERIKKMQNLPFTLEMEAIFHEYRKSYRDNINDFKVQYYQDIVDIEGNILQPGQTIYYVYGKGLAIGVIEEILPFMIGFYGSRIKIKGKKHPVDSYVTVIKNV